MTHQSLGLSDQARSTAEDVVSFAMETHNNSLLQLSQAFAAELALRQDRLDDAARWAQMFEPQQVTMGLRFYCPELTLVKVWMAQNSQAALQRADELLMKLLDFFTLTHKTCFQIQVLSLQALLHESQRDEKTALSKLGRAVEMANPNRFVRLFVDLGPKMEELLGRLAGQGVAEKFIRRLLSGFKSSEKYERKSASAGRSTPSPADAVQQLAEPLTKRELEILRLLAPGLVNKEIASKLFISPETVKKHTQSIYRKLEASNRRQAVAQAYELGILSRG